MFSRVGERKHFEWERKDNILKKNLVIGGEKEEKEKEGNIWSAEEKRNI